MEIPTKTWIPLDTAERNQTGQELIPGGIKLGKLKSGRSIELRGIYYETGVVSIEKKSVKRSRCNPG